MASKDSCKLETNTREESQIKLTEDDIPGAKLAKSVDECGCTVLRRWLLCRGGKTSGKLADLRRRVSDYMKSGLDSKYLRDPDGGVNILRKKAEAGILPQSKPDGLESYPSDGYSADLSDAPKVSFGTVWKFMIETVSCKKQIATAKPLVKGYNFFMSNHVLALYHCTRNGKHYIKSQVLPSMKKSSVYTCFITISSMAYVLSGKCGCPAGIDGRCNHVSATLFALESFHKKRGAATTGGDLSCTSKECKWSVPRKRKGPVQPITQMKFRKHVHGKVKKDCPPMFQVGKDVRAQHQRNWSEEKIKNMFDKLKEAQHETGHTIGWCHILPQEVAEPHRQGDHGNNIESQNCERQVMNELISPIKEHPISLDDIKQRCEKVKHKLFVSPSEINKIEEETREQSSSALWHFHRKCRITASKCYRIAVMKKSTSPSKTIHECLYSQINPTKYMKEGLTKEPEILELYKETHIRAGHEGLIVCKSGFVVSKAEGFLGASPDGVVQDPSVHDPEGTIEMKYIQTNDSESLEEALVRKRMCTKASGALSVNRRHQYFYQIQQTMYVTERKWTDFVVMGSGSPQLYIERINFDSVWWGNVKINLEYFFDSHLCPEIAYPRIRYGLPRMQLACRNE